MSVDARAALLVDPASSNVTPPSVTMGCSPASAALSQSLPECEPQNESGKKRGGMMWERYGQNWVYEDNEWRVLHNQVMLDFGTDFDNSNPGQEQWEAMKNSGWIWNGMMPGPPLDKDRPGPANMDYFPVIAPQRTVMPPEPYKTYEDGNEYIPESGDGIGEYRVPDFPDNGIPRPEHP